MRTNPYPFWLLRIFVLSRKRPFADIISWFVFFLLTIGFCTIYLWFQFETGRAGAEFDSFIEFVSKKSYGDYEVIRFIEAFKVILINSLVYTLIMLPPVYLNLNVFKKYFLDRIKNRFWGYTFYVFAAIFNALVFAGLLFVILENNPELLKMKIGFPINVLAIFGIELIATGLLYRKEVLDWEQKQKKYAAVFINNQKKTEESQEVPVYKNHIKIGTKTKYEIIELDAIIYLKAAGNYVDIFTNDKKGKYFGSSYLGDFEKILPPDQFIRVHKSYIISKAKVTSRNGNFFKLKGTEEEIPIGKNKVDDDDYLGFETDLQ